jgi:hypothetical protein
MTFSTACGLAFHFNPYDQVENPQNIFLGTANNCYIDLRFRLNYYLSPKWVPNISFDMKHFSNGAIRLPNLGVNLLLLSAGVIYRPAGFEPVENSLKTPEFIRHNQYNIALIIGTKNFVDGQPNYTKAALGVNWLRAMSYKHRLGMGLDIFYLDGVGERLGTKTSLSNSFSVAAVASWEWVITKRLYVPVGLGVYLNRNKLNDERRAYYERIGLRYRFDNNMFAGVTIKAHLEVADFVEWTVGFTLKNDKNSY